MVRRPESLGLVRHVALLHPICQLSHNTVEYLARTSHIAEYAHEVPDDTQTRASKVLVTQLCVGIGRDGLKVCCACATTREARDSCAQRGVHKDRDVCGPEQSLNGVPPLRWTVCLGSHAFVTRTEELHLAFNWTHVVV